MDRLIVGCGYLGQRVARLWRDAGDTVWAVTRSPERAKQFQKEGLTAHVGDILQVETLTGLPEVDTVLFAVGYDRTSDASIEEVYVKGFQNLLDALPTSTCTVIHISSTGVYAQDDGDWVDENSVCEPVREGGRACLAAEQRLRSHRCGVPAKILRLAGLYGPGRIPRCADLMAGRPLPASPDAYLNLIHVDDAARVVLAASGGGARGTYTISDGSPTTRGEYFGELARLLGAPAPRFVSIEEQSPRRAANSKRVRNDRMIRELGIRLKYPSYREGLAAIVAGESNCRDVC